MTHILGEKRQCTECSRTFYDLNRKPIICPACGFSYQIDSKIDNAPSTKEDWDAEEKILDSEEEF